jgi:hypothetical protein
VSDPRAGVLISLCERALAGALALEQLVDAWPEPVENAALLPLRRALEDGVAHTPGHWPRPGVDVRAWQEMPEYGDIEFYLRRLREQLAV